MCVCVHDVMCVSVCVCVCVHDVMSFSVCVCVSYHHLFFFHDCELCSRSMERPNVKLMTAFSCFGCELFALVAI